MHRTLPRVLSGVIGLLGLAGLYCALLLSSHATKESADISSGVTYSFDYSPTQLNLLAAVIGIVSIAALALSYMSLHRASQKSNTIAHS